MSKISDNNIQFDKSKKQEIQAFINWLEQIAMSTPDINSKTVYHQLCIYGLKKDDFSQESYLAKNIKNEYFTRWDNYFSNNQNIDVYCSDNWPYFEQFTHFDNRIHNNYIKLYVPLDKEHLFEGSNRIFNYISSLGIYHQSKIGSEIRSDNVVIRLDENDYESAIKIINFINSDSYIKEGLNGVNPFLPTINNIGIMFDDGRSYNSDIACILSSYINALKSQNRYDGNVDEFIEYCIKFSKDILNKEHPNRYNDTKVLLETLNNSINDISKVGKKENSFSIIINAVQNTYEKYGYSQVLYALTCALNGNYNCFTNNDGNFRDKLKENVTPKEIREKLIKSVTIFNDKYIYNGNDNELINFFMESLFQIYEILKFDEICDVTLKKRGVDQLIFALKKYIINGDALGFSRFKDDDSIKNYREMLMQISNTSLSDIMIKSLKLKGLDTSKINNLTELINFYSNALNEENVKSKVA